MTTRRAKKVLGEILEEVVDKQDENHNKLPSSSAVKNNVKSTHVIDLTTDDSYSPAWKKLILPNCVIDYELLDDAPSTSRSIAKKRAACSTCARSEPKLIYLLCNHILCYICFIQILKDNREPDNCCPIKSCAKAICDELIKKEMLQDDYYLFLEHALANCRRAIAFLNDTKQESDSDTTIITEQPKTIEKRTRRYSELLRLQNLEKLSVIENTAVFECSICFVEVGPGHGIVLKDCFHSFCKECLVATIENSEDFRVICPHGECEFYLQDREVKALVKPDMYEKHLLKALKRGEATMENAFHCKTPDCAGFFQNDKDAKAFPCEVCWKVNCIKCQAIHEDKTCDQYQADLKNDVKNQQDLQSSEEAVSKLIASGEVTNLWNLINFLC